MQPTAFQRPLLSPTAASVDDAFDLDCFDFSEYLGRRLGVDHELGVEVLGHWLRTYEPADQPGGVFAPVPAERAARPSSGIALAVTAPLRGGTDC